MAKNDHETAQKRDETSNGQSCPQYNFIIGEKRRKICSKKGDCSRFAPMPFIFCRPRLKHTYEFPCRSSWAGQQHQFRSNFMSANDHISLRTKHQQPKKCALRFSLKFRHATTIA